MFPPFGQSGDGDDVDGRGRAAVTASFNALGVESRIGAAGRPQQRVDTPLDQQHQMTEERDTESLVKRRHLLADRTRCHA